jgi:hypothetical protein
MKAELKCSGREHSLGLEAWPGSNGFTTNMKVGYLL